MSSQQLQFLIAHSPYSGPLMQEICLWNSEGPSVSDALNIQFAFSGP